MKWAALALAVALAACGPAGQSGGRPSRGAASTASERAYRAPPAVESVTPMTGGRVLLAGRAEAGSRVRLATPAGQAAFARADKNGCWRIVLATAPAVRLFGLSMIEGARTVQAEGYLALTQQGVAAQLRAGAGAEVLSAGGAPRILAVDFDHKGGTVVSGIATPGANLNLGVDGVQKGKVAADGAGRFALALDEPLSVGDHQLALNGAGLHTETRVSISPAEPLRQGPFRAQLTPSGWRIDWMTPGGGAQTTLLIDSPGPAR